MPVRKEQAVADIVESVTQQIESLGSRGVQGLDPVLRGETVRGGKLEAAPAQRLVVVDRWATAAPAPVLDVVREEATQPERVIAQVRANEEGTALVRRVDLGQ